MITSKTNVKVKIKNKIKIRSRSESKAKAKANVHPISSPASQLPPSVPRLARLEPKELKSRSAHACRAPHLTLRNWDEAPYTLAAIPPTCRHGQTRKYCTTPYLSATQVDYCRLHVFRQYYLRTHFRKNRTKSELCVSRREKACSLSLAFVARRATEAQPCTTRLITTLAHDPIIKSRFETRSRSNTATDTMGAFTEVAKASPVLSFTKQSSTPNRDTLAHTLSHPPSIPN